HVAAVVGGGAAHTPGRPPRNLPELLRTVVAARAAGRVGGEPRRRIRPAPDRSRRQPQRPRRRFLQRTALPERRDVLHARPRRSRSALIRGCATPARTRTTSRG